MKTKMTMVVDNTADLGLRGEWGLSALVEYGDKKILIDTGASEIFADNLKGLGFDIGEIDHGILSHAHYDHANGMPRFFRENSRARFYLRKGTQENCYFKKFIFHKYIGIPRNILTDYADRIELVEGDYEVCPGVHLIPHKCGSLEAIGKRERMYQRTERGWRPDDFCHEQSAVFETEKGLLIVNSCSHAGVVNIIREVQETFPDQHIYGMVGGFHLFNKPEEEVRAVACELRDMGIEHICTGHCTKDRAYEIMKEYLGDRIEQFKVGMVLEI